MKMENPVVLDEISLQIESKEIIALVGSRVLGRQCIHNNELDT